MATPESITGSLVSSDSVYPHTHYSENDRKEIVEKINQLVNGSNHQVVFFEYQPDEKLFSLIRYGVDTLSFSNDDVPLEETKESVKRFFGRFFQKFSHIVSPVKLTIIDAVYRRIYTTFSEVHDTRRFHPVVPGKCDCFQGRLSSKDMPEVFIEDTFDNLTGKRINW